MKLSFAISPCPNDTFMLAGIACGRIDTEGIEFDISYQDIQTLNKSAFGQVADVTKVSTATLAQILDDYQLLNSGSALGFGVGPLLVSKPAQKGSKIDDLQIAIPGLNTTAFLLLKLAFPLFSRPVEMLFSEIEEAVLLDKVAAGLIIHEQRFTYQEKGLVKLLDLGAFWEERTGLPVPLAGIVVRRTFDSTLKNKIDRVLRRSIDYAFKNPTAELPYIRSHAQEMNEKVMYDHIALYVNEYSKELGKGGKEAFKQFFISSEVQMPIENLFLD